MLKYELGPENGGPPQSIAACISYKEQSVVLYGFVGIMDLCHTSYLCFIMSSLKK